METPITTEESPVAAAPLSASKKLFASFNYPADRKPEKYTGPAERDANLEKFTEFYMQNKVDKETGKSLSVFKLIVRYNDEVKPAVPYWPTPSAADFINAKLKKKLVKRLDYEEVMGKTVVRPKGRFGAELHSGPPGGKLVARRAVSEAAVERRTLEDRVESLADNLIDSAQDELNMAGGEEEDPAMALKRKAHAVGVFAYISRHVHKKKELDIKNKASQIGEATFLMELMGRATAGKLDIEQLSQLETAVSNEPLED